MLRFEYVLLGSGEAWMNSSTECVWLRDIKALCPLTVKCQEIFQNHITSIRKHKTVVT